MARGQIGGYRMKLPASNPTEPVTKARGSWNLALLMPHEPGRRNHRPIDAVLLASAAFVIGLGAVIAESASAEHEGVEQLHSRLGDSRFTACRTEGRSMPLEAAVALALADVD